MGTPQHVLVYTEATSRGGAEVSLRNLLAELDPSFTVTVMGVDEEVCSWVASARPSTPVVVVSPVADKRSLRSLLQLRRAIARLRPTIFHANLRTVGDARYAVLAALTVRGVRVVVVEQLPFPPDSRLSRLLKRATSRRLAAHVAVGERAARLVEEQAGLRPGSVQTIYNGVPDHGAVSPPGRVPIVVGTLARLDPIKGLDVLLAAVSALDVEVVIAGDGRQRSELQEQATDRVRVQPWTDDAQSVLGALDVFVLPSRNEGFPLSIVEAMLAGLPVVATDVGSVSEAVDESTGILVPPDDADALRDAIVRLAADPGLRRALGEAGRRKALARFTSAEMARAFERLYAAL